jgi:hypothetical protein
MDNVMPRPAFNLATPFPPPPVPAPADGSLAAQKSSPLNTYLDSKLKQQSFYFWKEIFFFKFSISYTEYVPTMQIKRRPYLVPKFGLLDATTQESAKISSNI